MKSKNVQLRFEFWVDMIKVKSRSGKEKEMDIMTFKRVRPRGLKKKKGAADKAGI